MLTVSRLRITVPDIEELQRTNATVGCDGATFVRKYFVDDEHFEPGNIIDIRNESEFQTAFKNGTIQAAVLEVPYAKVFVNQRCKQYEYGDGSFTRKFVGFGFVFQKDNSTLAHNVSKVILKLSETGKIKELEKKLYTPSSECMKSTTEEKDSLCIEDFLGLFIIYAAISIICFSLYLLKRRTGPQQTIILGSAPPSVFQKGWGKITMGASIAWPIEYITISLLFCHIGAKNCQGFSPPMRESGPII